MQIIQIKIERLLIIRHEVFKDVRRWSIATYPKIKLQESGRTIEFGQDNASQKDKEAPLLKESNCNFIYGEDKYEGSCNRCSRPTRL